jgi:hypothetical protein
MQHNQAPEAGRGRMISFSLTFFLPFVTAAWTYSFLGSFTSTRGLGAAVVSAVVALLVSCAACVREEDASATYGVAGGIWAVAGAFFAMPFLLGEPDAVIAAWIGASDLSFAATLVADRFGKESGHGEAGRIISSAVATHGVLLAAVFAIGSPWGATVYTVFLAAHAVGVRHRLRLLASGPSGSGAGA